MRLGLLVRRLNQLPHLQSLARSARQRGHDVALILDTRGATGAKASQRPDQSRIPAWWQDYATHWSWAAQGHLDALVVPGAIAYDTDDLHDAYPGVPRFALQTSWSELMWLRGLWDAAYCWSPWWATEMDRYQRATGRTPNLERRTGQSWLDRAPIVPVGYPLADELDLYYRPAARRRIGLPEGKPVFILAPFPFDSHDRQGWRLKWAYRYFGDRKSMQAIRQAVDARGGFLVVKSRPKTTLPAWTRDAADLVVEDAEAGEPTMLHLLSVASGAVGFYSTTVLEAAAAGCPWLCLAPKVWPAYGDRLGRPWWEPLHDAYPVSTLSPLWRWAAPDIVWPDQSSLHYVAKREQYVRTFLGGVGAGERIVLDLEARTSGHAGALRVPGESYRPVGDLRRGGGA